MINFLAKLNVLYILKQQAIGQEAVYNTAITTTVNKIF